MKLIPKLQKGSSFYTIYDTIGVPDVPKSTASTKSKSSSSKSSSDSDEDTKGKITIKDLFTMVKEMDGLKNEKDYLFDLIDNFLVMENLTGSSPRDLSLKYSRILRKVKDVVDNKKEYDKALETAINNGALHEPAITPKGNLLILKGDGDLAELSLELYAENPEAYDKYILTVSNVAYLRKYIPEFKDQNDVFNTMYNSVGFESFLKLIDSAKLSLGDTSSTISGQFTSKAAKGLQEIEKLKENPQFQKIINSQGLINLDGLYEYKIINESQLGQIKALTSYLESTLPDRVKVWAAYKLKTDKKEKAIEYLIYLYLIGGNKTSLTSEISYKGSINHAMGKSSSGNSKDEDPKMGYWSQVQAGQGGETSSYNLLQGRGFMTSTGKYYGAIPGISNNCSLGDFITQSGVGYLILSKGNITFGDAKISTNSYNDVMVNAGSGMFVVTLPMKEGHVDFSILDEYLAIDKKMRDSGLKQGTQEYNNKYKKLITDANLDHLIDSQGLPRKDRFGRFVILEGLTSDKARIVNSENKTSNIEDTTSNFFINAGDDPELYSLLQIGLSNKDRGNYEIKNPWYGWGRDNIYKGNIYIPISNNPINGMNADENDIKMSTSYDLEEATLTWKKQDNFGSSKSKELEQ